MMSATTALPLPTISAEVRAFAEHEGVTAYLPAVLEMTRRIFPVAPMQVIVEEDPEIRDDRHIVIEVAVPDWDADQLYDAQRRWTQEVFEHCPSTHVCAFRVGVVSRL
jgi:hypothetical protein